MKYVNEPEKELQGFKALFKNASGTPIQVTIDALTEYKFRESKTSNSEGLIDMNFNSYPEDQIKQFRVTYFNTNNEKLVEEISGNYSLNNESFYEIILK